MGIAPTMRRSSLQVFFISLEEFAVFTPAVPLHLVGQKTKMGGRRLRPIQLDEALLRDGIHCFDEHPGGDAGFRGAVDEIAPALLEPRPQFSFVVSVVFARRLVRHHASPVVQRRG